MTDDEMSPDGSGVFGAKLFELHRVGAQWFPAVTDRFHESVGEVHSVESHIASVSRDAGEPAVLREILDLRRDLHEHLYATTKTMTATGEALIRIAEDYLATDEAARADYERLRARHPEFNPRRPDPGPMPGPDDPPPPPAIDTRSGPTKYA